MSRRIALALSKVGCFGVFLFVGLILGTALARLT